MRKHLSIKPENRNEENKPQNNIIYKFQLTLFLTVKLNYGHKFHNGVLFEQMLRIYTRMQRI
jgi:hypothetical protein